MVPRYSQLLFCVCFLKAVAVVGTLGVGPLPGNAVPGFRQEEAFPSESNVAAVSVIRNKQTSCRYQFVVHHPDADAVGGIVHMILIGELLLDGEALSEAPRCRLQGRKGHLPSRSIPGGVTTDGSNSPHLTFALQVSPLVLQDMILGVPMRCGQVVSCVHVMTAESGGKAPVSSLDQLHFGSPSWRSGRQLLALHETMDIHRDMTTKNSTLFTTFSGLVAAVVMVMAMVLCVCKDTKTRYAWVKGEPARKEATPVTDRKSQNDRGQTVVTAEEVELGVDIDTGNRHSNGSAVRDQTDNGRPRSHDHRALPAIPPNHPGAQTDDDEEEEGHYDIIIKHGRQLHASAPPSASASVTVSSVHMPNLYEKVDNDPDSLTKEDSSDLNEADIKSANPYAIVDGIGKAEYTHIGAKRPNVTIKRVQALDSSLKDSTETLDSYGSIPPPPVPDKHFDTSSDGSHSHTGGTGSMAAPSPIPDDGVRSSPSLPPRNGTDRNSDNSRDAVVTVAATGAIITTTPNSASVVVPAPGSPALNTTGKKEKEASYSSVTARESLANLRERHAAKLNATAVSPSRMVQDATYESVNYDQIKGPGASSDLTNQDSTADRQSLTSDLYAEIASGSGENSNRSSTYARVADVHAPTPPPVDILKQLSSPPEGDDDMPDPGYSKIRRPRPQSAFSAVSSSSGQSSEPQRDELYAVVDKSKKNRNTVHISNSPNLNTNAASGNRPSPPPTSLAFRQEVYAVVQKPKKTNREGEENHTPSQYVGTGARPKVKDNGVFIPPTQVSSVPVHTVTVVQCVVNPKVEAESDYHTIGSVGKSEEDPDYDNIPETPETEENTSEYDPNYEKVKNASDNITRVRVSPGVATEILPGGEQSQPRQNTSKDPNWQKRDHIYQEIGETRRERERIQAASAEEHVSTSL